MSINSDNIFIRSDFDNFQLGGKKNKKSRKKSKKSRKNSRKNSRRRSRKNANKKKSNDYSVSIFDEEDNEFSIFNPGYDKKVYPRHRDDHLDNYRSRHYPSYNGVIMSPSVVVHSPVKSIEKMVEDAVKEGMNSKGSSNKGEGRIPQIHPMAREMMGNKLSHAVGQHMQQMPYEAMTNMPQVAPQVAPQMAPQMLPQVSQQLAPRLPYETMTQQVVPQMAPQMNAVPMMGEGQLMQQGGEIKVESDFETYSDELKISSDFAQMVGGAKRKNSRRKGSKKRRGSRKKQSKKRPSRKRPSRQRKDYNIRLDDDDEELFERVGYSNYFSPTYYSPVIISSLSDGLQPYNSGTVELDRLQPYNSAEVVLRNESPNKPKGTMRGGKKVTKVKLTKLI